MFQISHLFPLQIIDVTAAPALRLSFICGVPEQPDLETS